MHKTRSIALALAGLCFLPVACKEDTSTTTKDETSPKKDHEAKTEKVAKVNPKTPEPTKKEEATTTEFVASDKSFTVQTPRQPRTSTLKVPTTLGEAPTEQYTFNAAGAPGAITIMVSQLPVEDALDAKTRDTMLTDVRDALVKKYNASIVSDDTFGDDKAAGRDFKFSATHPKMGPMLGRSRIVLRGKTMYQALRIGAPNAAELHKEGDAILDSLTLK